MGKKRNVVQSSDQDAPPTLAESDKQETPGEVVPYEAPKVEGEVLAPAEQPRPVIAGREIVPYVAPKTVAQEPSKKIAFVIVPGLINPPLGRFTLGDRVEWPNSSSVNPDHQDNVVIEDIRIRDRMVEIVGRSEGAEYKGQTCMWLTALVSCVVVYHGARPETLDPECVSDPTNGNVLHKKFLVKP